MKHNHTNQRGEAVQALQGMLERSHVPCGLYVACGDKGLPGVVSDLIGRRTSKSSGKSAGPLLWVDSGNRFDAYRMAHAARQRGLDPHWVLRSIRLARPFTAFQFHEMIGKIPGGDVPPVVIISDLMSLFYDPELNDDDAQRAFRQFEQKLKDLSHRAIVIALYVDRPVPFSRSAYLPVLFGMARRIFTPSQVARRPSGMTHLKKQSKALQQKIAQLQLLDRLHETTNGMRLRIADWATRRLEGRRFSISRRRFQWSNPVMAVGRHG